MAISHRAFGLSFVAAVLAASGVHAQGVPAEGPVAVSFTATQISPLKPIPAGDGKEFIVINQAMTATNDAGNPVLNNMGGRCQFSRLNDPSAKTAEMHGYCVYSDSAGDQIFERCDFLPGAPNNCSLTGGTGKFENIQGALVITAGPIKGTYDGIAQIIGRKQGTYKIVKTN